MRNKYVNSIILVISLSVWASCNSTEILTHSNNQSISTSETVNYSLIYMIHGDASYLYHDRNGKSRQADKDILNEAISVAEEARHGEVFIFHQKPERKILWIFPKKDRLFLHFRNGKLVHRQKYSPIEEDHAVNYLAESQLYRLHRSDSEPQAYSQKIFLYFGHEIPRLGKHNYHTSQSSAPFNLTTFSRGLQSFLSSNQDSFDLTVLSTCNNGTPEVASQLLPYTRYLLASPQNLHLSHIDTDALTQLEQNSELNMYELAQTMAERTFKRLTKFIQTGVSISLYDLNKASDYLSDLTTSYHRYLEKKQKGISRTENTDCVRLPFVENPESVLDGVNVWYQPPRFGRNAGAERHSGWGCRQ